MAAPPARAACDPARSSPARRAFLFAASAPGRRRPSLAALHRSRPQTLRRLRGPAPPATAWPLPCCGRECAAGPPTRKEDLAAAGRTQQAAPAPTAGGSSTLQRLMSPVVLGVFALSAVEESGWLGVLVRASVAWQALHGRGGRPGRQRQGAGIWRRAEKNQTKCPKSKHKTWARAIELVTGAASVEKGRCQNWWGRQGYSVMGGRPPEQHGNVPCWCW